jgi:N6-adenosine-specific RNA methylase IME4
VSAQPSMFAPTVAAPPRAGLYGTVLADPAWLERGGGQIKRGADRHYALMKTRDIAALPVGEWAAPDAHLYLWVTNTFLEDGFLVLKAWGFRYITTITWVKDKMGIGQYYRGMTEHVLFGVRGQPPYRMREDGKRAQGRTVIFGAEDGPDLPAAFEAARGAHSVKPEAMRRIVESVSAGPYLEMFARRAAPGWDLWGNEVPEADV